MYKLRQFAVFFAFTFLIVSCGNGQPNSEKEDKDTEIKKEETKPIIVGAEQPEVYLDSLKGKRIGMILSGGNVDFELFASVQEEEA